MSVSFLRVVSGVPGLTAQVIRIASQYISTSFQGWRLKMYPNQPLGWVGWQGIVPAKAAVMAQRITDMVTGQLLNVRDVFGRLDPDRVSRLMAPGVDRIATQVRLCFCMISCGVIPASPGRVVVARFPPHQSLLIAFRHAMPHR